MRPMSIPDWRLCFGHGKRVEFAEHWWKTIYSGSLPNQPSALSSSVPSSDNKGLLRIYPVCYVLYSTRIPYPHHFGPGVHLLPGLPHGLYSSYLDLVFNDTTVNIQFVISPLPLQFKMCVDNVTVTPSACSSSSNVKEGPRKLMIWCNKIYVL